MFKHTSTTRILIYISTTNNILHLGHYILSCFNERDTLSKSYKTDIILSILFASFQ